MKARNMTEKFSTPGDILNRTKLPKDLSTAAKFVEHVIKARTAHRIDICLRKNNDYADPDSQKDDPMAVFSNFMACEELGICSAETGILVRMTDKFKRMINLLKPDHTRQVLDEAFDDTALDLQNYVDLLVGLRQQRKRVESSDVADEIARVVEKSLHSTTCVRETMDFPPDTSEIHNQHLGVMIGDKIVLQLQEREEGLSLVRIQDADTGQLLAISTLNSTLSERAIHGIAESIDSAMGTDYIVCIEPHKELRYYSIVITCCKLNLNDQWSFTAQDLIDVANSTKLNFKKAAADLKN